MIVRYNPWQEFNNIQRQLDRLFAEDTLSSDVGESRLIKTPAAELHETDNAIYLQIELPGIAAKDLDIQVTENAVSVTGERKNTPKNEEKGVTKSEFYYGKFQRVIPLPAKVQNTQVVADYQDGILHLNLPKIPSEQHKVFKVNLA
ncbi:Hsp20/alpha crystallin family protein [Anabaena sp. UHCC 0253]|nr:Hsp20/alpha crystallin family protein [Anabaena sp. UHCC 0253]MTJ54033.1 Hsp20/alpha crystallin family protein [Anabaena sp. UHCC 0253]